MRPTYVVKKFNLTDNFKRKIEKKISKLNKFFDDDTEIVISLSVEGTTETVELTIYDNSTLYRAETADSDVLCAVDSAVEKIYGQIRKYKTRLEKRLREGAYESLPSDEVDDEEVELRISRVKKFAYKPMSVEEAILQMQLLGHQFFVFRNYETDGICVVYMRKNGDYGLIQPE